jgi:hypothetical protein
VVWCIIFLSSLFGRASIHCRTFCVAYILCAFQNMYTYCLRILRHGYPTEVFPWFFRGCEANARVKLAKRGHSPHSAKIVVLFYVLFVLLRSVYCLCVNVYCTVLYCTVLYCTILYCTVLYCTVLYCTFSIDNDTELHTDGRGNVPCNVTQRRIRATIDAVERQ